MSSDADAGLETDLRAGLEALLDAARPRRCLAVGARAHRLLEAWASGRADVEVEAAAGGHAADRLPAQRRFDFALVSDTLERLDEQRGGWLVARVRDVLAPRMCVVLRVGAGWSEPSRWDHAALLAHGLRRIARYGTSPRELHLYGFDIERYKDTPDWLNPSHWAHPELWGKYRW